MYAKVLSSDSPPGIAVHCRGKRGANVRKTHTQARKSPGEAALVLEWSAGAKEVDVDHILLCVMVLLTGLP